MNASVFRKAALALLPASFHVSWLAAAATVALIVPLGTRRRRVRLQLPVAGFLAAAGLVVLRNPSADALLTLGYWLVGALVLLALYVTLNAKDARLLALGAAVANFAASALALYQVLVAGGQASLLAFHPNLAAAWLIAMLGLNLSGLPRHRERSLTQRAVLVLGLLSGLTALALTASRSGLLAVAAGVVVFALFGLSRVRLRTAALGLITVCVLVIVIWQVDSMLRGPQSPNLLTNSGFESGKLPWILDVGSESVMTEDGGSAVLLGRNATGFRLLRYVGGAPVDAGLPFGLSLSVLPQAEVSPSSPDRPSPSLSVSVAIDAYAADGTVLSRFGSDGWTESGSSPLTTVGNRPGLPDGPIGAWQRVSYALSPLPPGTTRLSLELQARGGDGAYGLVDDIMLAPIGIDAYVPGRRPGLVTPLAPTLARLQLLRNPLETSGGRVPMWLFGLDLAAARPVLGYGLGSSQALVDEYAAQRVRRPLQHFHSLYVQLLVEGGTVLFSTFLLLVGSMLAFAWRSAIGRRQGGVALLATLLSLLVQSAFDPVLSFIPVLGGLWLLFCVTETG